MSASISENPTQKTPAPGSSHGMLDQLSDVLHTARRLENALKEEKTKSEGFRLQLQTQKSQLEQLIAEERSKNEELRVREQKYRAALASHQAHDAELSQAHRKALVEISQLKTELQKYQQSWAMVLEREREAKSIIQESLDRGKRLTEAEEKLRNFSEELMQERKAKDQTERHSKSYQSELQNALVRLHSSEARFSELSKELHAMTEAKRNVDSELKKVEAAMKERFSWELTREKERIKTELERKMSILQDSYKEEVRQNILTEYERRMNAEREHHARIARAQIEEIGRLKNELENSRKKGPATPTHQSAGTSIQFQTDSTQARYQELQQRMVQMKTEAERVSDWLPDPVAIPTPPPFRMTE